MSGNRIEELPRDDETRSEKPMGMAELAQSADTGVTEADGKKASERGPLFADSEFGTFHQQWQDTQTEFVDDPRSAVRHADELVASVMKRLAEVFATERERLEHDWDRGENVSTEDLRQVLRRYRSFFDRLLSV
jgi:hypothetical protein